MYAIFRKSKPPIAMNVIETEIGVFARNQDERQENWILINIDFPSTVVVENHLIPDEKMFNSIKHIVENKKNFVEKIASYGIDLTCDWKVHFLYKKGESCYFDLENEEEINQFKINSHNEIFSLK